MVKIAFFYKTIYYREATIQYRFEFVDGTVWLTDGNLTNPVIVIPPSIIEGTIDDDVYGIWGGERYFNGGKGNDSFFGIYGDNTVIGGDGDDLFSVGDYIPAELVDEQNYYTGEWSPNAKVVITGGKGNDIFDFSRAIESEGGFYATLNYDLGDGQDTIIDGYQGIRPNTDNLFCTIKFGNGITKDMVSFAYHYSDDPYDYNCELIINISNSGDQITIKNIPYYRDPENNIVFEGANYKLEFIDGTVINDLYQFIGSPSEPGEFDNIIEGTDKNDRLIGSAGNDYISGGAGHDVIVDTQGQNLLEGGDGYDNINGTGTLIGGTGNDTLTGSGVFEGGADNDYITANIAGQSDTFIFTAGDGQDIINSIDTAKAGETGTDILQLNGITADQLDPTRYGNNLIIKIGDKGDQITLVNYFRNEYYQTMSRIELDDGTILNVHKDGNGVAFVPETPVLTGGDTGVENQLNNLINAMAMFAASGSVDSLIDDKLFDSNPALIAVHG